MVDMPRYKSHKVVQAAPIKVINQDPPWVEVDVNGKFVKVDLPSNFFARGAPVYDDYLVVYRDGYHSWSPKAEFEDGYALEV